MPMMPQNMEASMNLRTVTSSYVIRTSFDPTFVFVSGRETLIFVGIQGQ